MISNKRISGILGGFLIVVGLVGLLLWQSREPKFEGRPLSAWLMDVQIGFRDVPPASEEEQRQKKAEAAILAMGPAALPDILARLEPSPLWSVKLRQWARDLLYRNGTPPPSEEVASEQALAALRILGPTAASALPRLTDLARRNPRWGPDALLAVGQQAVPAVTDLLEKDRGAGTERLLTSLASSIRDGRIKIDPQAHGELFSRVFRLYPSSNPQTRVLVTYALGAMRLFPEQSLPLILPGLGDSDPMLRNASIHAIGDFGDLAKEYAPALIQRFASASPSDRVVILQALRQIPSAEAQVLPLLVESLDAPEDFLRMTAAGLMGGMRTDPDKVIAALLKATRDSSSNVQVMAIQALGSFKGRAKILIPALEPFQIGSNPQVREIAKTSLARLRNEISQ